MVARYTGRNYSLDLLRQKSGINREGVSQPGISEAAEEIGFHTVGGKAELEAVAGACPASPGGSRFILWWYQRFLNRRTEKPGKGFVEMYPAQPKSPTFSVSPFIGCSVSLFPGLTELLQYENFSQKGTVEVDETKKFT